MKPWEVMRAYENGEQIQTTKCGTDNWRNIREPGWNWVEHNYRVKPKESYTLEQIQIMLAYDKGEKIQAFSPRSQTWIDVITPQWQWTTTEYRIKPKPEYRPWAPDEVPIFALYRYIGQTGYRQSILGASPNGVTTSIHRNGTDHNISFEDMLKSYEYSVDQGKTWNRCGVLVND